jgi:hypothetical protein
VRFNGTGGDFVGTLKAGAMGNNIDDRLVIDNNHFGTIELTGPMSNASIITVGASASAGSANRFIFPAGGLRGQVVVNGANTSGVWDGTATVGGVALSPSVVYANLSADLGGGAIGAGTYSHHREDSVPSNRPSPITTPPASNGLGLGTLPNLATWTALGISRGQLDDLPTIENDNELRIRFYGPLPFSFTLMNTKLSHCVSDRMLCVPLV